MPAPLRVIFAGTPDFAAGHLRALLEQQACNVIAVYTQPDRPAGRGKQLAASPVKTLALEYKLPVFQPLTLRDETTQQQLHALNADLMIVVAYGLILPKAVLDMLRLGCINVHASLLPRWRGAAPIQRAIEAGDVETGVTIMQMDVGLDTGDMLLTRTSAISPTDTGGSLHDTLLTLGCQALIEALPQIASGTLQRIKQNDHLSNYAPKISKAEAQLDWKQPAIILERKVRAFNPFPVTYFMLKGEAVRVWQAKVVASSKQAMPGTILNTNKDGILVATGDQALLLQQLQLPGKKALAASDILNSNAHPFTTGTVLT